MDVDDRGSTVAVLSLSATSIDGSTIVHAGLCLRLTCPRTLGVPAGVLEAHYGGARSVHSMLVGDQYHNRFSRANVGILV